MNTYAEEILGSDPGSGTSDLLSDQWEVVEKLIRKMENSGKKKKGKRTRKKLKRLEEQIQVLAEDYQRLVKLETKVHKKKKSKKGKVKKNQSKQLRTLELQCQQQHLWTQEILANTFLRILSSTTGSMNWLPPQSQPVIELPPSRDRK